jgi:hypothetical protein
LPDNSPLERGAIYGRVIATTTMTIVTTVATARAVQPTIVAVDHGSARVDLDALVLVKGLVIELLRDAAGSVATTQES